jgi:RND family efflux transporter MFP subunit
MPSIRYPSWLASAAITIIAATVPAPLQAAEPLPVEQIVARYQPSSRALDLTGTVEAADVVPVAFKSAGRITSLTVDVGARVSQNDVLAELDPTQANAILGAANAQFAAATAQLTQAQSVHERLGGLVERGATTRASLDNAQQELMSALALRDEAQAQLAKARQAVADTKLRAPVTGIVTNRSAEEGQVAGAGQTVVTIARDGTREAQFYVPALPEIDSMLGSKIEIMPLEEGSQSFQAEIHEISPLVNSATGTISLRARIDAEPDALGLGTPVKARVEIGAERAVILPAASLVTHGGKPAVWVIDAASKRVAIREIEVSRFTSDSLEVREGLSEGDLVVGSGAYLLFPGRAVNAVEAK